MSGRLGVRVSCAWLLVLLSAGVASAHPIHTTLTVVTMGTNGEATMMVRAFADDFSAAVARFAGKPVPADSSAPEGDVERYLRAKLRVADGSGRALPMRSCGVRREHGVFWACVRAGLNGGTRGAVMRNAVLTEMHADQVNIVQFELGTGVGDGGRGRRWGTVLFTRGGEERKIG